ncbi:MAG: TetR/AcrR family transcriptional regulator [Chloroflexota bacterium]
MYSKSLVTIAQILDAAQRLFVAYSYDDISMAAIAHEAEVTKGAIYHHFKGKEDLFLQMMIRYLECLQELLHGAVVAPGSTRKRLALLTTLYLEQALEEQKVMQLVRRDANRFGAKTREQLIRAYQAALPNQIEAIISEGIASEQVVAGDARLLAWQFVAIVEVCLSQYARQQFESPKEMATSLTTLFFDGAGAD